MLSLFLIIISIFLAYLQIGIFGELFGSPLFLNFLLFLPLSWLFLSSFYQAIWLAALNGFILDLWLHQNIGLMMLIFILSIVISELVFTVWLNKSSPHSYIGLGVLSFLFSSLALLLFFGFNFYTAAICFLSNLALFPFFFLAMRYLNNRLLYVFKL